MKAFPAWEKRRRRRGGEAIIAKEGENERKLNLSCQCNRRFMWESGKEPRVGKRANDTHTIAVRRGTPTHSCSDTGRAWSNDSSTGTISRTVGSISRTVCIARCVSGHMLSASTRAASSGMSRR